MRAKNCFQFPIMGSSRHCWVSVAVAAILLLLMLALTMQDRSQLKALKGASFSAQDSPAHATEKKFTVRSPLYVPGRRQPCGSTVRREKVPVDNRKAIPILEMYQPIFADAGEDFVGVNPNKVDTVKTWWQAGAIIDWYTRSDNRYRCRNITKMGNWRICQDQPYTVKPPCLVYSFGIARDFSFDDAMAELGCEVHSFDPSMGMEDKKRGPKSFFWSIGLGSVSTNAFPPRLDEYVKEPTMWKIRTLSAIKETLGHSEQVIDVLKMDIEGYEWSVLQNLLETGELTNARQFSLEFHLFPKFPAKADYVDYLKAYTKLREDLGFLEYKVNQHRSKYTRQRYNVQSDVCFVNSFFDYGSS